MKQNSLIILTLLLKPTIRFLTLPMEPYKGKAKAANNLLRPLNDFLKDYPELWREINKELGDVETPNWTDVLDDLILSGKLPKNSNISGQIKITYRDMPDHHCRIFIEYFYRGNVDNFIDALHNTGFIDLTNKFRDYCELSPLPVPEKVKPVTKDGLGIHMLLQEFLNNHEDIREQIKDDLSKEDPLKPNWINVFDAVIKLDRVKLDPKMKENIIKDGHTQHVLPSVIRRYCVTEFLNNLCLLDTSIEVLIYALSAGGFPMLSSQIHYIVVQKYSKQKTPPNLLDQSAKNFFETRKQILQQVKTNIHHKWKEVAKLLDFADEDIDDIRLSVSRNENRLSLMLNKFFERDGKLEALVTALVAVELDNTAELKQ